MNKLKIGNVKKILILLVISIVFSLLIEIFFFNYRSIARKNVGSDNSITLAECNVIENGDEWRNITYSFSEPTYVSKIMLEAIPQYNIGYAISAFYLNPFEEEKNKYINDTIIYGNNYHCTYIGETLTEVTIIIPTEVEITKISFLNSFQINKYRLMIIFGVLFVVGNCLVLSKFYQEHLELLFLLIGGGFGLMMILIQGPTMQGWDGEAHFENVYEMAYGQKIENSVASQLLKQKTVITYNTLEEKLQVIQFYNTNASYNNEMEKIKDNPVVQYNEWGYVPIAIFYKIGLILGLNFNRCYMLGEIGNLIIYLLAYALSIKITKSGKMIIFCIGLMPTPLFIATTYTYDSFVNACIVLGFTLIYNYTVKGEKDTLKWFIPTMAILLIAIGSMPKAVYIPMVLFVLCLLQNGMEKNKPFNMIIFWGTVIAFLIGLSTFAIPTFESILSGNVLYASDQRGGDTSMLLQLISIVKHPIAFLKLLIHSIFSIDNFRNYGSAEWDNHLVSSLCFLNVGMYGTMPDKYVYLIIPYITALTVFGKEKTVEKRSRTVFFTAVFLTVLLIWTALYLAFTPVGENEILGVQARYYLPLIAPTLMMLPSPKIKINGKTLEIYQCKINNAFILCTIFCLTYCVYFLMFKKTCM